MNQQVALSEQRLPMQAVPIAIGQGGASIAPQNLGEVVKFAEVMCRADIALPPHLRGNAGACMAVALQALEWQMSPFAVASKSYAVKGAIAYEAQLIAAVVNTRSGIKGRLRYDFRGEGDELYCVVTGVLDGQECTYETPPFAAIQPKNSPLWKTDPRQQLGYYGARSWARRHCPEVILGVYDRDEVEHFGPQDAKDVTPSVMQRLQARSAPQQPAGTREGFDPSHVARETEGFSTGQQSDNEPSPAIPGDAGSDTADPQAPNAQGGVAAEPTAAADPGAGDDEADGPTSPPAPVTDAQRNSLRARMAECRDKFLAIGKSADDAETKRHAAGIARDAWNDELPDHKAFVKACLEAAGRVGKGGKEADERAYLDGLIARAA